MKARLFISILLFQSTLSLAQASSENAFKIALKRKAVGKEISFSKTKGDDLDSLVLVYLGEIKAKDGRQFKILASRWYWGLAPRATSRIIIFNGKNQYLGDYYLTMTYDVPDKIEGTSLVFVNKKASDCSPGVVTRVSFKNGIPRHFSLKCNEGYGEAYTFAQNL